MNWLLLKNSLLVSGGTTLLAMALGFVVALWLTGLEARARNPVLAVTVAALALPPFLVTNCWLQYLGANGAWRGWFPFDLFSLTGTIWLLALLLWPVTTLAVWGAWRKLQASHLEAEPELRGAVLVRWLMLPMARSALGLAAVVTFVLALNNFAVPSLLQVKVFPVELWVDFNTTLNSASALRAGWPLIVLPALMLLWFWRRDVAWPRVQTPAPARLFRRQLGRPWFWLCGAFSGALALLSVGLPIVQLASVKRTWTELPDALAAGQGPLWTSVWLAVVTATVVVALGLLVGMPSVARQNRLRAILRAPGMGWLLWLPFLAPGVILGIGLIALLNREPFLAFYRSAGVVVLAFAIRYLAIGWNGAAQAMRMADPALTDAARLEGASRWQLLRHVLWPQIAAPVAAAWYVVYLLCLWDVESLVIIQPPGGETLALRVFNLLHYGHNAQVNALCLTLLALAVAPLAAWGGIRAVNRTASEFGFPTRSSRATVAGVLGAVLLLTGCTARRTGNETPLASRFFSAVQTIGSRGVGPGQFNKPRSVVVDRQDNLYVVDMTARVQKFAPDGRYLMSWQMPRTDFDPDISLALDAAGNVIVLEPHHQRVSHFSPDGRLVAQWGERGTNAGQFQMPCAIAVDSHGGLFVSEYDAIERIQKFAVEPTDPGGTKPAGTNHATRTRLLLGFATGGTGPGELNRAEGMGVDQQDRLYVADSCNHRIQVFSDDGKLLRVFGKAGNGKGELSYPYDVCVDAEGHIFVCEFGNSRIQMFDAGGESLEIIGGPGAEPGRFANPWSVALDSHGNLYVADLLNHRVQKLIRKPGTEKSVARRRGPQSEARRQQVRLNLELRNSGKAQNSSIPDFLISKLKATCPTGWEGGRDHLGGRFSEFGFSRG